MKAPLHTGGTVTGRFSRSLPEHQELTYGGNQLRRDPERQPGPVSILVTCDFAEIEKRIMGQLADKTGVVEATLGKRK